MFPEFLRDQDCEDLSKMFMDDGASPGADPGCARGLMPSMLADGLENRQTEPCERLASHC